MCGPDSKSIDNSAVDSGIGVTISEGIVGDEVGVLVNGATSGEGKELICDFVAVGIVGDEVGVLVNGVTSGKGKKLICDSVGVMSGLFSVSMGVACGSVRGVGLTEHPPTLNRERNPYTTTQDR
jgi:hypothetical protein